MDTNGKQMDELNFEVWAVQRYVNLVDRVEFSNENLHAKIVVDTFESEPLRVVQVIRSFVSLMTNDLKSNIDVCSFWILH